MWVFEETVNGQKLTDIINKEHENVKYLKGAKFTPNLVAGACVFACVRARVGMCAHACVSLRTCVSFRAVVICVCVRVM